MCFDYVMETLSVYSVLQSETETLCNGKAISKLPYSLPSLSSHRQRQLREVWLQTWSLAAPPPTLLTPSYLSVTASHGKCRSHVIFTCTPVLLDKCPVNSWNSGRVCQSPLIQYSGLQSSGNLVRSLHDVVLQNVD